MKRTTVRLFSILFVLLLWEGTARLGVVPKFLLVPPTDVLLELVEIATNGTLWGHIAASMSRVLAGFCLALASGVLFGLLMGWFSLAEDLLDPLVELVRPVSPLAILPLTILWFGIGQTSKIFVIWYGCFFPILLNTIAGVRSVPRSSIECARTLGALPNEMLRKVVLYHSLPLILTGARISFAVGMIVMVASEMINADRGLGYVILMSQQTFRTTELYAGIVTIAAIGFLGDRVLRHIRSTLCPWYVESEKQ